MPMHDPTHPSVHPAAFAAAAMPPPQARHTGAAGPRRWPIGDLALAWLAAVAVVTVLIDFVVTF